MLEWHRNLTSDYIFVRIPYLDSVNSFRLENEVSLSPMKISLGLNKDNNTIVITSSFFFYFIFVKLAHGLYMSVQSLLQIISFKNKYNLRSDVGYPVKEERAAVDTDISLQLYSCQSSWTAEYTCLTHRCHWKIIAKRITTRSQKTPKKNNHFSQKFMYS